MTREPTPDAEQEYFADGIAEDIIKALSRFHWFFVSHLIFPSADHLHHTALSYRSTFCFEGFDETALVVLWLEVPRNFEDRIPPVSSFL